MRHTEHFNLLCAGFPGESLTPYPIEEPPWL